MAYVLYSVSGKKLFLIEFVDPADQDVALDFVL